jgi:Ca2+-binding RTX toxin-like protein
MWQWVEDFSADEFSGLLAASYVDGVFSASVSLDAGALRRVFIGDSADDVLVGTGGDDFMFGFGGRDTISGRGGDDFIEGGSGSDFLFGGSGDDEILGGSNRDTIQGNAGDDLLVGGLSADRMLGGSGEDTLFGGPGDDVLTGGGDADIFQFSPVDERDRITDFEDGLDRIEILAGASDFGDLDIFQSGTRAVVAFAATRIVLADFDAADLSGADFIF